MKVVLRLFVLIGLFTSMPALAQAPTPIGKVDSLTGHAVVISLDGSTMELAQGDSVYQGDTLETSEGAAIGVVLSDESVFSLDELGSLTLDSMVYDPASETGSAILSLAYGVFTFVSGQIAKTGPDAMVVRTPSAEVGIRGTAMGLMVSSSGYTVVTMLEEVNTIGGELLISNKGGVRTLNQPLLTVNVENNTTRPSTPFKMALQDMGIRFGGALRALPKAKKLIHKKIRAEAARQFKAIKTSKAARNIRRNMIKRYQKNRRTQNTLPTFNSRMDSSGMAQKGAANRMRDAIISRPEPKPGKATNPCSRSKGKPRQPRSPTMR